jgi:hypothetical protein
MALGWGEPGIAVADLLPLHLGMADMTLHSQLAQEKRYTGSRSLVAWPIFVLLTSIDRRSKDISIHAIIITELEFCNIERHIFSAHFVECADHAVFEYRPGLSLHLVGVCVNRIGTDRSKKCFRVLTNTLVLVTLG